MLGGDAVHDARTISCILMNIKMSQNSAAIKDI